VDVRYSWEPLVLGSGGGPRRAFDLLECDRAFIVNGDTLTDLDLTALAAAHAAHQPLVTMASTPAARPGYNALAVDTDGRFAGVTRVGETPALPLAHHRHVHFIGVQVAERAAFATAPPDVPSETLKAIYPGLIAHDPESVRVWSSAVAFHDVGTPADYLATVRTVAAAEHRALDHGEQVAVAAGADVTGTVIWNDVAVGAGAVVRDSVLADGVTVPPGRHLSRVAAVPRALVPAGARGEADGGLWIVPLDVPK
jgi:mannose-1-phosphate guanylyltransferase